METQKLKIDSLLVEDNSLVNALSLTYDLPTLVEKMKLNYSWERGELNAMILLKGPNKQMVLTSLHEGTEIDSFQSNDFITLQIIEGQLKFRTRKDTVTLDKGQLLTLHEKIKYSLSTKEKTVFLLTIEKGTLHTSEN